MNGAGVVEDEAHDIVQIRIALQDIEPPIWRRVQVPTDFPLRRLHDLIQAVMGWLDSHLHQFEIGDKLYGQSEIAGEDHFGPPLYSDRNTRLAQLLERGIDRFTYTHDFGDDWCHEIEIERTLKAQPGVAYPILVAGERRGPPEDCGGPLGSWRSWTPCPIRGIRTTRILWTGTANRSQRGTWSSTRSKRC